MHLPNACRKFSVSLRKSPNGTRTVFVPRITRQGEGQSGWVGGSMTNDVAPDAPSRGARRTARPARDLPGSESAHVLTAATGRGVAKTPDAGVAGELGFIFR